MILIVDDDSSVRASLALLLKQAGYRSHAAASPAEALAWLESHACDLVLQDMNFSRRTTGEEGLELLGRIRALRPDLPVLGLSHIAEEADELWTHGVPLVLSGHTHGGQVTLAGLHELMIGHVVGHRYVHGLYGSRRREDPQGSVYVGAGVGAAVVPLRLGERGKREVTFFELGTSPGAFDEHHLEQPALPGRAPTEKQKRARAAAVEKKMRKAAKT